MEENQTTQSQQPQPTAELTVTDLSNLRSIVDVAVKRGTFNASEISAVGNIYDKLNAFLTAVAAQQKTENKQ